MDEQLSQPGIGFLLWVGFSRGSALFLQKDHLRWARAFNRGFRLCPIWYASESHE